VIAAAAAAGLTCGLPATAASAATAKARALPLVTPTTVTWHQIGLQNGWKSAHTSVYNVANPSYSVYNGVVYLDGTLTQPAGTNKQFGVLPLGYRPAHTLYLTVLTGGGNGTPGAVEIKPTGVMTASSPSGSARAFTSLAAVSFPAASAQWTNLSLQNGWKSGATAFGTGSPAYTIRSGIVYLAGSTFTNGTGPLLTTLPANARPVSYLYITVYVHGGLAGYVEIRPDGEVFSFGFAQTSLDGISFATAAAPLTWHNLTLATGWSSSQSAWGTGDPKYAVSGPLVYLAGSMHFDTTSGGSTVFAVLPTVTLTSHLLNQQVYTDSGTTGVFLVLTGDGWAASTPISNSQGFTSLAGISYPRNS
jgi:hypothetical protein